MDTSIYAINALIEDCNFIQKKLILEEPSIAQDLQKHLKKMLVLSYASHYENEITAAIKKFSAKKSEELGKSPHGYDVLSDISFFKLFDFGRERPNPIKVFIKPLKVFGKSFSQTLYDEMVGDSDKERHVNAFQDICRLRNLLAHNDLIVYDDALENKTFAEIQALNEDAVQFVELLKQSFT